MEHDLVENSEDILKLVENIRSLVQEYEDVCNKIKIAAPIIEKLKPISGHSSFSPEILSYYLSEQGRH